MGDVGEDMRAMREDQRDRKAQRKVANMRLVVEARDKYGVQLSLSPDGNAVLLRDRRAAPADFYPSTGRWRPTGQGTRKLQGGDFLGFLAWAFEDQVVRDGLVGRGVFDALDLATETAERSPCVKSKRAAVAWNPPTGGMFVPAAVGWNAPPGTMMCGENDQCREECRDRCVHAEARAILALEAPITVTSLRTSKLRSTAKDGTAPAPSRELDLLHLKVVDGIGWYSGPPSCPRCSGLIAESRRFARVWLLRLDERTGIPSMVSYEPEMFHRISVEEASKR